MRTDSAEIKRNKFSEYLTYFFICLPPIIYFTIVGKFALNIPYYDDYPAILKFLNDYKVSGPSDRFFLLFAQYNEHRIFFARLIMAIYYSIFGNINFRDIIFIGNTQLIFVLIISVHFIKKALPQSWQLASVLISLFIFDISSWNNADWAMASLQNYSIILLFLISLYFYNLDKKRYLFLGALFQAVCTFSSGNGIIASFCLVFFALFSKDKLKVIFTVASFLLFTALYFVHYKAVPGDGKGVKLFNFIVYLLHTISGHIFIGRVNYNNYITVALSFIYLFCFFAWLPIGKKLYIRRENLPFVAILLFILGTMVVICRFRQIPGFVPSRYLIYCHYITGILFLFYLIRFQGVKYSKQVSIIFALLMLYCYGRNFVQGYGGFKIWHEDVINNTPDIWVPSSPEIEKAIADESCKLKIYCMGQERIQIKNY